MKKYKCVGNEVVKEDLKEFILMHFEDSDESEEVCTCGHCN